MKSKRLFPWLLLVATMGAGIVTLSPWLGKGDDQHQTHGKTESASARNVKYYKSTMMLGEISETPRKDSMGMDMVPVYEGEEDSGGMISISPVTIQNMGVRTGQVTKGSLKRRIRTVGNIQVNETAVVDVTTKFKGWIEKLNVNATGQQVRKGDVLFEIYSPEIFTALNEYLLSFDRPGNLRESALTRLRYFDVPEEEIASVERRRKVNKTISILAPADGVVIEKMVVQGQMVEAGMQLYRLADLSMVWLQAQIFEQDLPFIKLGQEASATFSYLAGRRFSGRVTYLYPTIDVQTRTAQVRMEFHNPGLFLKPGMFATVEIEAELSSYALLVPDTAILRSGNTTTVFVALDGGKFEPRKVSLGPRSEGAFYQVLGGLKEGERVVTSAQFMLDSESQLREAIQKMLNPGTAETSRSEHSEHNAFIEGQPEEGKTTPERAPSSFECPMPEHSSIKYEVGGSCPICSMTLIPSQDKPSGSDGDEGQGIGHQH
jgi:Cu(I)/Ag(I) efflux system membrane fusion protein